MIFDSYGTHRDSNQDEIYSLKPTENIFEKNKSDLMESNLLRKTETKKEKHPTLETEVIPQKTNVIYKGILLIVVLIIILSLTRQFL